MNDLALPDDGQLQKEQKWLLDLCATMEVIDPSSYETAGNFIKKLGDRIRSVEQFFKPMKQSLDVHKRTLLDRERGVLEPLQRAKTHCGLLMVTWESEETRKRVEAEREARDIAAIAEAEHHERMGDQPAAEAALDGRGSVGVSVPSQTPKVAGVTMRETWSAEVTDLMALVKGVASGQVPLACVQANTVGLNAQARALKDTMHYPGVRAIKKQTVAA